MNGKWLSTADVAKELDVSKATVLRLLKRGLLSGHKITPGALRCSYRIDPECFARYTALRNK